MPRKDIFEGGHLSCWEDDEENDTVIWISFSSCIVIIPFYEFPAVADELMGIARLLQQMELGERYKKRFGRD